MSSAQNKMALFKTLYIASLLVVTISCADQQEFKILSGNTTRIYVWTLDSEDAHVLHCIAQKGEPLKWAYGPDREEFLGNNTLQIHVDTKNASDITMTFKRIEYGIFNEFYCQGLDPKNKTIVTSEATIDILVSEGRSNWLIFWWLLFLTIFMVAVVGICRGFSFNDYAVDFEK